MKSYSLVWIFKRISCIYTLTYKWNAYISMWVSVYLYLFEYNNSIFILFYIMWSIFIWQLVFFLLKIKIWRSFYFNTSSSTSFKNFYIIYYILTILLWMDIYIFAQYFILKIYNKPICLVVWVMYRYFSTNK